MKTPRLAILSILGLFLSSCDGGGEASGDGFYRTGWSGVDAELDHLTGRRTGMFRSFGEESVLLIGTDSVAITPGYYCEVREGYEPTTVRDGLFFRVDVPGITLMDSEEEAIRKVTGILGLLNVARVAVDGRLYAWEYRMVRVDNQTGTWYLYGEHGWESPQDQYLLTTSDRSELLDRLAASRSSFSRTLVDSIQTRWWLPAYDYAKSHYVGRDSVGIELRDVARFALGEAFDSIVPEVRFHCEYDQHRRQWNRLRESYFVALDSVVIVSREREWERERRALEQERQGLERVIRTYWPEAPARGTDEEWDYARRTILSENDAFPVEELGLESLRHRLPFLRESYRSGIRPGVWTREDVQRACSVESIRDSYSECRRFPRRT